MIRPRLVLVVTAWAMALIGWQTSLYHPDYLALAPLWTALAVLASLTCLAASVRPLKGWVALSGATVVCSAAGRSAGIMGQLGTGGVEDAQRASFTIAALTWALVAFLAFLVWSEFILPWSIGGRHLDRRPTRGRRARDRSSAPAARVPDPVATRGRLAQRASRRSRGRHRRQS